MKINPEIGKTLREFVVNPSEGTLYLLGLYFDLNTDSISTTLKQRVHISKIVEPSETGLKWNIPLFPGAETAFEWVKSEYVPLFSERNTTRGGKVREATSRMKKLFAQNPELRKEEVLGATKMYLRNTDPDYIRFPHYFIEKGKGGDKSQDILDWVDKYRIYTDTTGRSSTDINMQ